MSAKRYRVLVLTERHPNSIKKPFGLLKCTVINEGSMITVGGFKRQAFTREELINDIPADYVEAKNFVIELAIGESFRKLYVPAKVLGPL